MNRKGNLEAWVRCSSFIQQESSNSRWCHTQYYLTSPSNLSSNSVAQKCLPTTTSSMNEEKMTLIVGNRPQDSIKSSSLVRIEDCPLLIHQSSHFIYIILLSLQERVGYSVSSLLLWYHKLHLAISLSVLPRSLWSQWHQKALRKTFLLIPVTSWGDQYWLSYWAN